jgi:hypothetical protein
MTVTVEYAWKGAGEVRAYAAGVLTHIRERHVDPLQELFALVSLSLRRESLVTQLYDSPHVHERMDALALQDPLRDPIIKVARALVDAVWLQEAQHAEYLLRLKETILGHSINAAWNDFTGVTESHITELLLSASPILHRAGRIAAAIGTGFAASRPRFLKDLRALSAKAFCLFIAEMEDTAVDGYARIQEVTSQYYAQEQEVPFNIGFAAEMGRILIDERNHRALFRTMAGWFTRVNTVRRDITAADCTREVLDILGRPLSLGELRTDAVYAAPATGTPELLFDGGFAQFFHSHAIHVQVANEATALAWVGDLFLRGELHDPATLVR